MRFIKTLFLASILLPCYAHAQTSLANLPSATSGTGRSVVCVVPSSPNSSQLCTPTQVAGAIGSQSANTVFAAPNGSSGAPTFRNIVTSDIPTGTSGAAIPLLTTANSWSAKQAFIGGYPGISASTDFVRSVVGGFPLSDQYAGVGYQTNAIVGAVTTPSGAVTGAHIFDSGVSGYAQTNNVLRDAIGLYGEGGILVSGASAYGLNTEAINCENHSTTNCGPGKGFNVNQLWSVEADVSLYKVGSSAPTGNVSGVASVAYAETQPTGQFNAFDVVMNTDIGASAQPWKTGLTVRDGSASVAAMIAGATSIPTGGALNSLPVLFATYTSGGTQTFVPVYADSSQVLHVGGNSLLVDGATNPAFGVHNTSTAVTWYAISNSAGNLQFYNGSASPLVMSAGSVSSNVPFQLAPATFTSLPSCTSTTQGEMAYITDASAAITTWHQAVTAGGGANKAFVTCNGSGWFSFSY